MAYLTSERIEEWREEAQFQHDRYQRDGTGIGTVLALTQARLLHTLDELSSLRDSVGCPTTGRNEAVPAWHGGGAEPTQRVEAATRGSRGRPRSRHLPSRRRCPRTWR